jgi:polysaccharide export outer membrane protein
MIRAHYIMTILLLYLTGFLLPFNLYGESPPDKEYVIGAGDVLDIQVWRNDDLHRTVEVSKEGAFTFPLIGKVQAAGLSVFKLEQHLKERLADGYLIEPQVTVSVSEYKSQKIIVLGEVKKPGSYVIKGKTPIMEIISDAEGLTDRAGRTVTIVRPTVDSKNLSATTHGGDTTTIVVDLDQIADNSTDDRFFVINGDSIYVSKAPPVFITGEVNKPGEFKWEKGLTVHQVISLAGGSTKRGALNRTKIIRSENGQEEKFKPNLNDAVKPYDIINVPQSYF